MKTLFLAIYQYFTHHRKIFCAVFILTILLFIAGATRIRLDENISSFFPQNDENIDFVMRNMKTMDKIIVVLSNRDTTSTEIYSLIDAAEEYHDSLRTHLSENVEIELYYDDDIRYEMIEQAYAQLPILLNDSDFTAMQKALTDDAIAKRMSVNRELMLSPVSSGLRHILPIDPLGIGTPVLTRLQELSKNTGMTMVDGYMMDLSHKHLTMFINLPEDFSQTGDNARVIGQIRQLAHDIGDAHNVDFWIYGAPVVAVANSQCVKSDETLTLSIAVILVGTVVLLTFRRKRSIFLIMLPVVFGAIFAFAVIAMLGYEISLISIGAGATIFGVALSYSIHMVTHAVHARSIEELIADMAYPMTIGSITTIGAFVGLVFTDSKILHDLGLFSSLALVGTLIFSLIFLPHFMKISGGEERSFMLRAIEKIADYDYSHNRWLVATLCILTIICLFFFTDVRFDSDMTKLNYQGDNWIEQSKDKIMEVMQVDGHTATLVVTGRDFDDLAHNGIELAEVADSLKNNGLQYYHSLARDFLIPTEIQQQRIERWNKFRTANQERIFTTLDREAKRNGFNINGFNHFKKLFAADYKASQPTDDKIAQSQLYSLFGLQRCDTMMIMYFNISVKPERRDEIMERLDSQHNTIATDMGYYVRKATSGIVDDFNIILAISSLLVGLVLLISYGRIELFAMTFLPMCISWVIILGLMAIFNVEFNVVNIILSTFIFGVGDDFSIFIMDGLLAEYKTGRRKLSSHKTAIALSAFATIVGLGVQVFAQHPAIRSLGLISIFGLIAVIVSSYIVQPVMFKLIITKPAAKGFPWAAIDVVRALFFYVTFVVGCVLSNIVIAIVSILPMRNFRRQEIVRSFVYRFMRAFYAMICSYYHTVRIGEIDTSTPKVIIANHQSFIDIIAMSAISPKILFVTKSWVTNSLLFGRLARFCGFYNVEESGGSEMAAAMREYVDKGYSIVVFPEGTRSRDGEIHRFHKGGFKLAEDLKLDIVPMLILGNGDIASKRQPLQLKHGRIVNKVLPTIADSDKSWGTDYNERAKNICSYMRREYNIMRNELDSVHNPYYRTAIVRNFTYKDPHVEWYMRVKIRLEHDYEFFDGEIPSDAVVTDIGCGYGALDFMLAMRHKTRKIVGIDYDDEKIATAQHSFLVQRIAETGGKIEFLTGDATQIDIPHSNVFVVNDMLHYLSPENQSLLLKKCVENLNGNGKIIIRDGNTQNTEQQKVTRLTEIFSTKIFRFNKTAGKLCFTSSDAIRKFADDNSLTFSAIANDNRTSNTIYILKKK